MLLDILYDTAAMAPVSEAVAATVLERSTATLHAFRDKFISKSSSLLRRDNTDFVAGVGSIPPTKINNTAVFVIIGLIGAGFVVTAIWFFFQAKNGGFVFREGDWDEYKSTVLRRKGPNGTTLSGATESTDLGGGSVVGKRQRRMRYKDVEDQGSSIGTRSEISEFKSAYREPSEKKQKKEKKAKKHKKPKEKSRMRGGGYEESIVSEMPEDAVRAYRHEKPAKVGGMNRVPEGSAFDGSTVADSTIDGSVADSADLLMNRQSTPTNTPTKKTRRSSHASDAETRQVRSTSENFWDSSSKKAEKVDRERERKIKEEARKLQEKGRAASSRRTFSYTAGDDASSTVSSSVADERQTRRERRQSRSPEKRLAGSYAPSDAGTDVTGTKSYHHPIPGLSSNYADERRKKRNGGGYRRERGDDTD